MNNLSTNTIAVVFVVIVLVAIGRQIFTKKKTTRWDNVLNTKEKERLFPELVLMLKEEDAKYHMYTNMTQDLYEGAALCTIRDFYSGGKCFRDFIPHAEHGGDKRDNQFFDVYRRLWEKQLVGVIPFANAKEFIDEVHEIIKWLDTPLSDGSRRFVVEGKDVFPKERLIRMAQGLEDCFYTKFFIFQRAIEAYNLFAFRGYDGHISIERVNIPSKFYTKAAWEQIKAFADVIFMEVFVFKRVAFKHSDIVKFLNERLPKREIVPKWYEWLEVNDSNYGKTDEEIAKRRKS